MVTPMISIVVWGLYEFCVVAGGPGAISAFLQGRRAASIIGRRSGTSELLAREGVTVEERITAGADENLQLMLDPKSGVDVAFMQGGVAPNPQDGNLKMVASLYYEPLWVFYVGTETISGIPELRGSGLPSVPREAGLGNLRRPFVDQRHRAGQHHVSPDQRQGRVAGIGEGRRRCDHFRRRSGGRIHP